jgi:hypothetical protein
VKSNAFAKKAEWNCAFLATTRYSQKCDFVEEFLIENIFLIHGRRSCLLLNGAKKFKH